MGACVGYLLSSKAGQTTLRKHHKSKSLEEVIKFSYDTSDTEWLINSEDLDCEKTNNLYSFPSVPTKKASLRRTTGICKGKELSSSREQKCPSVVESLSPSIRANLKTSTPLQSTKSKLEQISAHGDGDQVPLLSGSDDSEEDLLIRNSCQFKSIRDLSKWSLQSKRGHEEDAAITDECSPLVDLS